MRISDWSSDVCSSDLGARQQLLPDDERHTLIDVEEIEEIVAKMARIPAKQVSVSDKDVLEHLERNLKMVIFGQDPAIETLTSAIKLARSGLANPDKPIGHFLFAVPTGVGTTEVTKQLALPPVLALVRFDMTRTEERRVGNEGVGPWK